MGCSLLGRLELSTGYGHVRCGLPANLRALRDGRHSVVGVDGLAQASAGAHTGATGHGVARICDELPEQWGHQLNEGRGSSVFRTKVPTVPNTSTTTTRRTMKSRNVAQRSAHL